MQFIVNLFGTVVANKDVSGQREHTGLRILDEKLRVLSNHVDFLLQSHFSEQTCVMKTCDEYTSEHVGCEDSESGSQPATASDGEEEDDGGRPEEVDADVPAGDSEAGRDSSGEGQAGAGSGEATATQGGANSQNSH
jgi:hypothetical protein